jgi:hypothetical protein
MQPLIVQATSSLDQFIFVISKLNFVTVVSIILFIILIFTDIGFKATGNVPHYLEDEEKEVKFWKVGFFHFIFGGLAIPKLVSLFGGKGVEAIFALLLRLFAGGNAFTDGAWFSRMFVGKGAPGSEVIGMLMFYVGLYFGVIYSLKTVKKFYQLERGRPVINWSLFFMLAFFALSFIYDLTKQGDPMYHPSFNFFDSIVKAGIFYALSKWYMYRIVITDMIER